MKTRVKSHKRRMKHKVTQVSEHTRAIPNHILNKKVNDLDWKEIKLIKERLHPMQDADKDGKKNYEDCRPLDKKRQDILGILERPPSTYAMEHKRAYNKSPPRITKGRAKQDEFKDEYTWASNLSSSLKRKDVLDDDDKVALKNAQEKLTNLKQHNPKKFKSMEKTNKW